MIPVRSYFKLLRTYLRPQLGRAALLGAVLLVSISLQLVNPQLVKRFIDGAVAGRSAADLIPLAGAFVALALAHQGLAVWSAYLAEDVGWGATNQLRADLTRHVLSLDMGYHKAHSPGELIERIDGDVTALSNFFSALTIKVAGNGLLVLGIVGLLAIEHPLVGGGIALFVTATGFGMIRLHHVAVPWWKSVRAASAEFYGFVGEQVDGTEDVKANGADSFMLGRFVDMLRRWRPLEVRGWTGWAMLWGTTVLLYVASLGLVMVFGWRLFGAGAITLGSVYLVLRYVEMAHRPIETIREQMVDLQKAGASIDRVRDILATPTALRPTGTRRLPGGPLGVEFDGVTFGYGDAESDVPTLHDVSFTVAPGRVLGLLGRTGSGKSTIARLVTRLYEPQAGEVRIGEVPTWDIDPESLRARVRMVTQDVQLFRASVRDNLTFFDPSIGDDRLLRVIAELGLEPWLAALPAGLDTLLESGAGGLSAGQAQLLAFARIFLADPGVVILDEASSRLDPATETLTERAVDRLLQNRTGIVIAHRLATVRRADDILILEDGRIVELGPREDLLADPQSRFSKLLEVGIEEVLA